MSPSSIPSSSRVPMTAASSSSSSSSTPAPPSWQIPQGHFLAQQGKSTSATHTHSSSSSSDDAGNSTPPYPSLLHTTASSPPPQRHDGIPTDTSTLAGADFDVDVRSGFLPPEPPLERIPGHLAESCWEQALDAAREAALNIHGGGIAVTEAQRVVHRAWRRAIRQMHVVIQPSHKMQTDIRFARRGHLVLTFLAHFYLHSQPQPSASQPPPAPSRFWWSRSPAHATQDAIDARDEAAGKYAATLPPSLSIPLLQLSSQLDIPPILTYADTVLWNWKLKDASKGLTPSNIVIAETFSGTTSEEHFYLVSLLIELRGVAALDVMRVCLDECFMGDALAKKRVAKYLQGLCLIIADLEAILKDVRSQCDPPTFYWAIRPWFRGGDASPFETKGWIYPTTVDAEADPQSHTVPRLFTGPSAGQSSLIHALDVFLDVDHAGIKPRQSRPALTRPVVVQSDDNQGHDHHPHVTADASSVPPDATFMQRMQLYMPGQHRRFLTHLQTLAADAEGDADADADAHMNIDDDDRDDGAHTTAPAPTPLRHLAMTTLARQPTHPLPLAYDAALRSLRSLRDEHMRVATLYIVSQARSAPPRQFAELSGDFVGSGGGSGGGSNDDDKQQQQQQHNGADTLVENDGAAGAGAKGTGGTNLVHFLKACRANTVDALLSSESA